MLRIADECPPKKIQWLVPFLVPLGKLSLLDGDPGQGKSFLTLELAALSDTRRYRANRYLARPDAR